MGQIFLEAFTLLIAGMMVGSELCVSVTNAHLDRLEERAQFESRQTVAAVMGSLMPPWYAATFLLSGAVAFFLRGRGAAALLADIAAGLFLLSIAYTLAALVPLNNQVVKWKWETRPDNWAQVGRTWDMRHVARVTLLAIGFLCLIFACLSLRS